MNFNRLLISIGPGPEPLRFSIADRSFRFSQYIVSASQRLGYFASLSNSSYTGNRDYTAESFEKFLLLLLLSLSKREPSYRNHQRLFKFRLERGRIAASGGRWTKEQINREQGDNRVQRSPSAR